MAKNFLRIRFKIQCRFLPRWSFIAMRSRIAHIPFKKFLNSQLPYKQKESTNISLLKCFTFQCITTGFFRELLLCNKITRCKNEREEFIGTLHKQILAKIFKNSNEMNKFQNNVCRQRQIYASKVFKQVTKSSKVFSITKEFISDSFRYTI